MREVRPIGVDDNDRWLELVKSFPLRPIRSDVELNRAIVVINSLVERGDLLSAKADYLDVLGDLVKKYETEAYPMPPVSDGDMLRHLIEARAINQADVAKGAGIAVSTISEVLAGKRPLNRRHIESLAKYFEVSPAVFIGG